MNFGAPLDKGLRVFTTAARTTRAASGTAKNIDTTVERREVVVVGGSGAGLAGRPYWSANQ